MHHELDAARLEAFASHLRRSKREWVDNRHLWDAFSAAFPTFAESTERRSWLLAAIAELRRLEIVKLPAAKSNRWDRTLQPAVPREVALVRSPDPVRRTDWKSFPWHPRLRWIHDFPRMSEEIETFLRRVHHGLVRDEFQTRAPLKYRSLQLTGREKRLGKLLQSSLFSEGRLTLDLLGCFSETPQLAYERIADIPSIIIFENADSFAVARNVLRSLSLPPFGLVGFGGGNGVCRSIPSLISLPTPIQRIVYVGDLDFHGLRIAARASRAASVSGLPEIQPATMVHRAMLQSAQRFGNSDGWEDKRSHGRPVERLTTALTFLDPELRDVVAAILQQGNRIPEEVLGPQELTVAWGAPSLVS
ncbi:MAG: hypothetical protein K8U03_22600 [Planctomycetia bacterium]|nr:hypothetical protein [Planctomycetia bacterium]